MKKLVVLIVICVLAPIGAIAQDTSVPIATGVGVEVASDGFAGLLVRTQHLAAGITARAQLYDYSADTGTPDLLQFGPHASYLIRVGDSGTDIGIGVDLRIGVGIGDLDYDEYIDAGVRISASRSLSDHFIVSGILNPLWIQTRDKSAEEDDWSLVATLPRASVAVAYLF